MGQVPARRNQQDGERRRRDLQVQEVLRGRRQQQQLSRRRPRQEEARLQPQRVPGQRVRQTTPRVRQLLKMFGSSLGSSPQNTNLVLNGVEDVCPIGSMEI